MRTSHSRRHPPRTLVRLPDLDDRQIPAWRFTRHAVAWSLGVFATTVVAALLASILFTMNVTVDGDGLVEPAYVWPVRSSESGIISHLLVQTGDTVHAGQVVAELDSMAAVSDVTSLEARILSTRIALERSVQSAPVESERVRAGVVESEAHVARARAALRERMANFSISGDPDSIARAASSRVHVGLDGPSADLLASLGELAAARAQLSSANLATFDIASKRVELRGLETMLTTSRTHLGRHSILAPSKGVVLTDQLEQLLGAAFVAGQTILEIADMEHWRATLAVSERDVHRIHAGDVADIEIPAFAAMSIDRFRGRVEAVGWQPAAAGGMSAAVAGITSGYRVVVRLDSNEVQPLVRGALRRGYAARGKIVTRSARANVLLFEAFREQVRAMTH